MADTIPDPSHHESRDEDPQEPSRRNLLVEIAAVIVGGIVSIVPFVCGLPMLLDPVFRKNGATGKKGEAGAENEGEGGDGKYVRVATIDSLPEDGTPMQFPVIAGQHDAWNFFPNQRIGSVFLRRVAPKQVVAFNAVCPHLGCLVAYVGSRDVFHCPCHNSAFHVNGEKVEEADRTNPSPRPLDTLVVDEERLEKTGEVWITFQNFYTGKEKEAEIMSGLFKSLTAWVEHRTGLFHLLFGAMYERIPGGARWRFVFGSMLVFCFITQVVTGVILWMGYSPSANTAWESVYHIQNHMNWGWVLRGLHHYTAQAMVVLLAFHMLQIVWDGAYKAPREFNYWFGLILAQIVLGLALTGYLLPWDQKGYWATKVATNLMGLTPVIGDQVQQAAVGGSDYGHHTLTRFFAMHAGVLPALLVVFLVIHLALFRRHGVKAESTERRPDQYFWPHQVLLDGLAFLSLLVVILVVIISTGGAELSAPADPSEQYSAARPEWYFLFLFQLLKKFESEFIGAIVVPGAIMAYLFAMPLIAKIKGGHWLNVTVLLLLIGGAGYLTYEAMMEDNYSNPKLAKYNIGNLEGATDEESIRKHEELMTASENFIAAKEQAHRDYERVAELIEHRGGIPIEGAISLQRSDPETMGPRLFKLHCASCHDYVDPTGVDTVKFAVQHYQMPQLEDGKVKKDSDGNVVYQEEPTGAPNLYGVGSADWLRGLLDPQKISLLETTPPENPQEGKPETFRRAINAPYFGNTAHRGGLMAEFVTGDLTELDEEQKAMLDAVIAAVSAQAQLKTQAEADEKAKESGLLEKGVAAFEETFASYACSDCHKMGDAGDEGSAPDLTGWMSEEWLTGLISDPNHGRFYGYEEGANDRMPAFAGNTEEPQKNILSAKEVTLLARWLRHDDAVLEPEIEVVEEVAEAEADETVEAEKKE